MYIKMSFNVGFKYVLIWSRTNLLISLEIISFSELSIVMLQQNHQFF